MLNPRNDDLQPYQLAPELESASPSDGKYVLFRVTATGPWSLIVANGGSHEILVDPSSI